ncbi:hypothetical protein [Coraliomargarita akajimensis]|uniref:Glycosyltransferase subfamily 4-like N-terminal domain-containing protein n=1 Tax=Coraliomargarita akajimensis (strain DSM 45221 / IAM 15411 / JCM 23193 / KCTC 12865 / 04OKA010-24) TaxID=583355 RepID=D5EIB5_CORAD|nr:hypothetical protein [Coraliomargarita akajimensis]ADE54181.1 conserved hypothetical protein [Coraliomargarita akajimensis DSM 45221]
MSDSPRVAIVHYHLKRGGVTRVIESTLRAFESLEAPPRCAVLAGEVPDDVSFGDVAYEVDGLGYSNVQSTTPSPSLLLERLLTVAKEALGAEPDIWHIHNHSLGKNSAMPGVVTLLAQRGSSVLLHMHDFAEDGRPANHLLNQEIADYRSALYPIAETIHYAVLNARDHAIFSATGIPSERLHLLANPVEVEPSPVSPDALDAIRSALGAEQLLLYPVRAVRRKNFGEMLYWSALADEGTVFANTLGPTNANYQSAYARWQSLSKSQQLPVHFGIGQSHDWSFEAIMQSASAILSTSIAEGFGLAFLEPWLFGKSIVGRDLPEITADFKASGIDLSGLYDCIPIPDHWVDLSQLRNRIEFELNKAYAAYGRRLPKDAIDHAMQGIRPAEGLIDFAGLEESQQELIIERIACFKEARQDLPRTELQICEPSNQADHIRTSYSFQSYAERVSNIYQSLLSVQTSSVDHLDQSLILDAFLQPERFRLLRT